MKKRKLTQFSEDSALSTKGESGAVAKEHHHHDGGSEKWSKSKKKRMRRQKSKHSKETSNHKTIEDEMVHKPSQQLDLNDQVDSGTPKTSTLQDAFKSRLSGSRFRILNEELYTSPSDVAYLRFSSNPELYHQYHEGFRYQVGRWPINPVDVLVKRLIVLASQRNSSISKQIVVADFGCGDAELAKRLMDQGNSQFQVHSFDLVAGSDLVTACDMASVPLPASAVDVGIFCLSLMGTNLADFIREAHRVMKKNGVLYIAEVRSRFETRNEQGDLKHFLSVLAQLGFKCVKQDTSNKMFLMLELRKNGKTPDDEVTFTAKPCIYKKR